jgi:pimeloyl-ACP methyl ester carboxylesterase
MTVPFDHLAPDGRLIDIGVIRVRAAVPEQREGSIFFNRGGPGSHPGRVLRILAAAWSRPTPAGAPRGEKQLLADRYDLVAVIPRGLAGSAAIRCVTGLPPRHDFLPTNLDDTNWNLAVAEAQSVVNACTRAPHARYVNTEQHAHDMEALRRALGDERIHIYGVSYGGMVAAWYAAMYPAHVGRMLLDSSLDFTRDYRHALRIAMQARHRAFVSKAVVPLLEDPSCYGLGSDVNAVTAAFDALPPRIRKLGTDWFNTPVRLAAALHVATWLRTRQPATLAEITPIIEYARLDVDPSLQERLRWEALQVATGLFRPPSTQPVFYLGPDGDSVRTIVPCNDVRWPRSEHDIRRAAQQYAAGYFSFDGEEILEELTCARWGGPSARPPMLSALEQAPPCLLLQSDRDATTPLVGAIHILDRYTNARMLLVRQSEQHGLFNFTLSTCIERTAARYLLTGSLPEARSRVLACEGTLGNPVDSIPDAPQPPAVDPVPAEAPSAPAHDEL